MVKTHKKHTISKKSTTSRTHKIIKKSSNTFNINNGDSDNIEGSIIIRYSSRRFLSNVKTARRVKRESFIKDKLIEFLDDNYYKLKKGNKIENRSLDKYVFNHIMEKCICQNILNLPLGDECKCHQLKKYGKQGRSGAQINYIICDNQNKLILKTLKIDNYYIKLVKDTKKYIILNADMFTIQTLINSYVYKELPNNSVNLLNSGICIKKKYIGYNLMEEANLGTGDKFINDLINKVLDKKLDIIDEDTRYLAVINFLLQVILIIGHLQSSQLEFFHGDYKPNNVFIKTADVNEIKYFDFKVYNRKIRIKNMGFVVLIADFDKSNMSIPNDNPDDKKYRIVPSFKYPFIISKDINKLITKYADIDPDNYNGIIELPKYFINKLIPNKYDPTIVIIRCSGVRLFRDLDIYSFMTILLYNPIVKEYIIKNKINQTIYSFMPKKFNTELFNLKRLSRERFNETIYNIVELFDKINETLMPIFSDTYLDALNILNYKLFKTY
jgi:hypothetical protein